MKNVLFVCTNNSARSQMAEGVLNKMFGDNFQAFSAGTEPTRVNTFAVLVMEEIGIDISKARSKGVSDLPDIEFDHIITICQRAKDHCPFVPGGKSYMHRDFEDPDEASGSDEEKKEKFREVRDEIKGWIEVTFR